MHLRRPQSRLVSGGLLLAALVMTGCSGKSLPKEHLEGAVLLDGKPLKAGTIRFVPTAETQGPATAVAIVDGFYDIPRERGVLPGQYRIEIEAAPDLGFSLADDEAAFAATYNQSPKKPVIPPQKIPSQYNSRSKLIREVTTDDRANKFDFDLRSQGALPGIQLSQTSASRTASRDRW